MSRRISDKRYPKLSWHEQSQRWRKRHSGKCFWYSGKPSKAASYPLAVKAYKEWKLGIDQAAHEQASTKRHYDDLVKDVERWQASLLANWPDSKATRSTYRELDQLKALVEKQRGLSDEVTAKDHALASEFADHIHDEAVRIRKRNDEDLGIAKLGSELDDLMGVETKPPTGPAPWSVEYKPQVKTVEELIDAFKASKQRDVEAGDVTQARVDRLAYDLDAFIESVGEDTPLSEMNATLLNHHRERIRSKVTEGDLAPATGRDRLRTVKQMLTWAYKVELLDSLPRVLDDYSIRVELKAIEVLSVEQIKGVLSKADGRNLLYVLLSLNTGCTQTDMSKLTQESFDRSSMTIRRSKTGKHSTVPSVQFPLWDETRKATEKHRAAGELLFTRKDGSPLVAGRNDSVASSLRRLTTKVGFTVNCKLLRRSVSTILGSHSEYGKFAQYFLGHSPTTVADRHYVKPNQEQFDEAVLWLGGQVLKPVN